ncbi:MAG TPA: ATP cone domain-containing protein [archaeon]|nr:ATP cone domain-containing protein [archaeon]
MSKAGKKAGNSKMVVKRHGHIEAFDERKLYGSIYGACESAHHSEGQCERTAASVSRKVVQAVGKKGKVSSIEIRKMVERELGKISKELKFYYEAHLPDLKRL